MKYEVSRLAFTAVQQAAVERAERQIELAPTEVLMRTEWSLISTGTELAVYKHDFDIHKRTENLFPIYPGYAAAGVVEKVGSAVSELVPGDRVVASTPHSSLSIFEPAKVFYLRLQDDLPTDYAPFIRMALISLAALCRADLHAGAWLGVVGLGIVGNLGAQFGQAAGYRVLGAGRSSLRSQIAHLSGIEHILSGDPEAIRAQALKVTDEQACHFVLDTTGTTSGVLNAIALAANGGTISLVGVPWYSDLTVPATTIMQSVFTRYLTLKGGWEWDLPLRAARGDAALPNPHSIEANARHAMRLMAKGDILLAPLITRRIAPEGAQDAYQDLLHKRDEVMAVLIDWRG